MARQARDQCKSGVYNVVLRGINRQDIFYDEVDYQRFLEIMAQKKSDKQFEVYGYCFMETGRLKVTGERCSVVGAKRVILNGMNSKGLENCFQYCVRNFQYLMDG